MPACSILDRRLPLLVLVLVVEPLIGYHEHDHD